MFSCCCDLILSYDIFIVFYRLDIWFYYVLLLFRTSSLFYILHVCYGIGNYQSIFRIIRNSSELLEFTLNSVFTIHILMKVAYNGLMDFFLNVFSSSHKVSNQMIYICICVCTPISFTNMNWSVSHFCLNKLFSFLWLWCWIRGQWFVSTVLFCLCLLFDHFRSFWYFYDVILE